MQLQARQTITTRPGLKDPDRIDRRRRTGGPQREPGRTKAPFRHDVTDPRSRSGPGICRCLGKNGCGSSSDACWSSSVFSGFSRFSDSGWCRSALSCSPMIPRSSAASVAGWPSGGSGASGRKLRRRRLPVLDRMDIQKRPGKNPAFPMQAKLDYPLVVPVWGVGSRSVGAGCIGSPLAGVLSIVP